MESCSAHLAVEGDAVTAVVVAIEGLCAEAAAGIPDGDCLVRGSCAEVVAEGLPAHLIHRIHVAPVCRSNLILHCIICPSSVQTFKHHCIVDLHRRRYANSAPSIVAGWVLEGSIVCTC